MLSFLSEHSKLTKKSDASKNAKKQRHEDIDWIPIDDKDCICVRDSEVNIYTWPKQKGFSCYDT